MKRFLIPSLVIGAALAMSSCADDDLLKGGANGSFEDDGPGYYINATIALPTGGSRSSSDKGTGAEGDETNSNGSSNTGNEFTDREPGDVTSGFDYEVGRDYENDVRSVLLVITDKEDQYLTHIAVNGLTANPTMVDDKYANYEIKTRIKYGVLEKAYEKGGVCYQMAEKEPMRLYAFCNYTNDMMEQFNNFAETVKDEEAADLTQSDYKPNAKLQAWRDFKGTVEEKASMAGQSPQSTNSIWAKRSFLMSNAEVYACNFPASLDAWDPYADDNHPLILTEDNGPIKVERVSARLDFRDGSPADTPANTYRIYINRNYFANESGADLEDEEMGAAETPEGVAVYNIRLTRMILVNMSKEYYFLRRVTPASSTTTTVGENQTKTTYGDPKDPSDVQYAKKELNSNWVVDTDWTQKALTKATGVAPNLSRTGITPETAGQYFNFPLFSSVKDTNGNYQYNNVGDTYGWYISTIDGTGSDAVLGGEEDQWGGHIGNSDPANKVTYHTWRYITENTLPSIEAQQTVQSTGIIFKGAIEIGPEIETLIEEGNLSESVRDALLSVQKAENKQTYPVYTHFEVDQEKLTGGQTKYENMTADKYKKSTNQEAYAGKNIPAIYSLHNMLYGGVDDIVMAAKEDNEGGAVWTAVDNILKNWYCKQGEKNFEYYGKYQQGKTVPTAEDLKTGKYIQLNVIIADEISRGEGPTDGSEDFSDYTVDWGLTARTEGDPLSGFNRYFIEHCPSQNITVFIPTTERENNDAEGWGYFCYYFYWLRHNDNGYTGKMGPMEFAAVRNNVYKLAVTKIGAIGHPRDTTRDPDPIDPNDPDEEPERSISVQVDVLPWVVRVNNIEF